MNVAQQDPVLSGRGFRGRTWRESPSIKLARIECACRMSTSMSSSIITLGTCSVSSSLAIALCFQMVGLSTEGRYQAFRRYGQVDSIRSYSQLFALQLFEVQASRHAVIFFVAAWKRSQNARLVHSSELLARHLFAGAKFSSELALISTSASVSAHSCYPEFRHVHALVPNK